jgi:hypothetical protein
MPYRSTPAVQTLPGRAAVKRRAADRHEAEALKLRAEAAAYEAEWLAYIAQRDAENRPKRATA